MATTLTSDGELTFASFPIIKTETTEDGDLIVYGKATDGSVDSDRQIVKPAFAYEAIKQWKDTGGNVRVQHNPQRDPAGVGIGVEFDGDATWVKSLVIEPIAKKLVSKGALRAYSVGIARPTIERDVTGKAQGGIITAGQIVEISLVDRPANKSCGIQLVKSEGDSVEFMNKVFGDEEIIAKFTGPDLAKSIGKGNGIAEGIPQEFKVPVPVDMTIDFTPNDLAKILQSKIIEQHYDELALKAVYDAENEVYKRDVNTAERRSLASAGNALPDGSYPIANAGDLHNAAHLAATGHGNAEAAKKLIARRAKELGVSNPLSENDSEKEASVTDAQLTEPEVVKDDAVKEAEPEVTKDPADAPPKKGKKAKKMPPWLNQDDSSKAAKPADDDDADDEDDDDASCKMDHAHTEKCSGTPKSASGAKDAADMEEIPDPGAYQHTPMPAGRNSPEHKASMMSPEAAAMLRFKTVGVDTDLGRLHDLTCAAYDPEDVAKYHPFADFSTLIDEGVWMRKAVEAATGPMDRAREMTRVWEAAQLLKDADVTDINDYRREMHKAFRDANPGPTSYPSPGAISPGSYHRPHITAGHAAYGNGYDGPNSSPEVASGAPNAHSFDRPPLSAGHQTPSPSFMKGGFEYPAEQGVPTKLQYAAHEKDRCRRAVSMMHDHLQHMFPSLCPMNDQDAYRVEGPGHSPAAVGKAENLEQPAEAPQVIKANVQDELDAIVTKGRKKMLKKLGKKVMAGKLSLDEARTQVGNRMSRKAEDDVAELVKSRYESGAITRNEALKFLGFEVPEEVTKSEAPEMITKEAAQVTYGMQGDLIKSAITDAVAPLIAKINEQQAKISEQEARWEQVANQADPKTTPFSGLALNMVQKSARPAGIASQAEIAERTQRMIRQQLHHVWRTSDNPAEREAAYAEYMKYGTTE